MRIKNIELGMAGQLRVASEMILRGHRPSISLIDMGIDLITEKGLRIQVKTARLRLETHQSNPSYVFNFSRWDKSGPHGLENVDFVICWGVDTNDFWIFPASVIRQKITFRVIPNPKRKMRTTGAQDMYRNNWAILTERQGDAQ